MGQVKLDATSMAPGYAVGWGELRSGSCSPYRCCRRCYELQKRERGHGHWLSHGQAAVMSWSLSSKPSRSLFPPATAEAMCCTTHLCCYKCTLCGPSCLRQAGLGETLVVLWGGHQELLPAAPQHNSTNSLTAPSLAAMLNWSPGTSARWPLPEPKSVQ